MSILAWNGGQITVRVELETLIDAGVGGIWGISDWNDTFWNSTTLSYQPLNDYVMGVEIAGGQERWDSRFAARSCRILLDNTSGAFNPESGVSLWALPFRPGRRIRVVAVPDPDSPDSFVPLFTGTIDSSNDSMQFAGAKVETLVTAFDGLADMHGSNPVMLETATGVELSSERVHSALDYMGWPDGARLVQTGLHNVQTSYLAQRTLEECQRAADAEGGAFFCDTWNNAVFKQRDWLLGADASSIDGYHYVVLADGPVAFWSMSGAGAATDSVGGHDLTWQNSPTTEQTGYVAGDEAVELNGSNEYATVANEGDVEILDDMSLEVWFKGDAGASGENCLFSCRASSDPLFEVFWNASNENIRFAPSSTAGGVMDTDVGSAPADEWLHLVVTVEWTDTTRLLSVYINGVLVKQLAREYLPSAATRTVNIGRRAIGNDLYFKGLLSEMAVFDYLLTNDQIATHYTAHTRDSNERSAEIQGYLGYDVADVPDGKPYADITDVDVSWELARIRNDIQFTRAGGTVQTATDSDSMTLYGRRSYPRTDFINSSDGDVLVLAQRYLSDYKDNRPRLNSVTLTSNRDPDNEDLNRLFYDTRYGDRLAVRIRTLHNWYFDIECHVIGIAHNITADDWTVTLTLTDAFTDESSSS